MGRHDRLAPRGDRPRRVRAGPRTSAAACWPGAIAFRLFVWLAAFLVVIVSILGFIDAAAATPPATLGDGGITAIAASEIAQAAADAQRSRWLLLLAGLYALFSTSRTMVRALWTASAIAARRPVTKRP